MNWFGVKYLLGILLAGLITACSHISSLEISGLRCEDLENPLAIDNVHPHFSWKLASDRSGDSQSAYQILVASDRTLLNESDADLWDSGKVVSSESVWIPYQGSLLKSKDFACWKVRVWDSQGNVSDWSTPACFGIGLLKDEDWSAQFIGMDGENPQSPLFRKSFEWNNAGEKAFLHVNSLGYHEVYLNGSSVSDAVLTPAVSQFNKRSLSVTYDLTGLLQNGNNELVIWTGKGWYQKGLPGVIDGGPFVRAQLEIEVNNDWQTFLQTDASWLVRESGYTAFGTWRPHQFGGEVVHADELIALDHAALDTVSWTKAKIAAVPKHKTSPQMVELNRIREEFHPIVCSASGDTAWIFDMGTNFTGWTKIKFPSLTKNQRVRISYCDFLDKNGLFRDGLYEDYYIASGKEQEYFINKFNYKAYRYLKLSNLKQAPALEDITAYLIHTDYSGFSSFACSDKDLNAIHDMVQYTLRCLTLGGDMVDCPQIERLGYGGDGNASTRTVQTMFNLSPLYLNWMQAWADCMREDGSMPHTAPNPYSAGGGPFWCGFLITGSWQTYVNYGDKRLLERYYPFMQRWLEYVQKYTVDDLLQTWPDTDYRSWYLGDWATPSGIDQTDPRSVELVNNCFISVCYQTMSKIATLLGNRSDAHIYADKSKLLKQRIHEKFYESDTHGYGSNTQIDLIYPLLAEVTLIDLQSLVMETLIDVTEDRFNGHLSTGLVGIPVITEWAVRERATQFMYNVLKKRDYPSYLYMIDNGATTTWEHWNGDRSHIHNCYNGIGSWFYQALAGILPDESFPGYKHIIINPQIVSDLSWVKAMKDTPYGIVEVNWELQKDKFIINVTIPMNTTATFYVPVSAREVLLNGKITSERNVLQLSSGSTQIICNL